MRNPEHLSRTSSTAYPLLSSGSKTSSNSIAAVFCEIPDDYFLDAAFSGQDNVSPENTVIFIHKVEASTNNLIIYLREAHTGSYDPNISSTFDELGFFVIRKSFVRGERFFLTPTTDANSPSRLRGLFVMGEPFEVYPPNGTYVFDIDAAQIIEDTLVPQEVMTHVHSLGAVGDPELKGDVLLKAGSDSSAVIETEGNIIRLSFEEEVECLEDHCNQKTSSCPQPNLMQLNGVRPNDVYSVSVGGIPPINVSVLATPGASSNPFDPTTFDVRGIVITYIGPIFSRYFGEDGVLEQEEDPDYWEYHLSCSSAEGVDKLAEIREQLEITQTSINTYLDGLS